MPIRWSTIIPIGSAPVSTSPRSARRWKRRMPRWPAICSKSSIFRRFRAIRWPNMNCFRAGWTSSTAAMTRRWKAMVASSHRTVGWPRSRRCCARSNCSTIWAISISRRLSTRWPCNRRSGAGTSSRSISWPSSPICSIAMATIATPSC